MNDQKNSQSTIPLEVENLITKDGMPFNLKMLLDVITKEENYATSGGYIQQQVRFEYELRKFLVEEVNLEVLTAALYQKVLSLFHMFSECFEVQKISSYEIDSDVIVNTVLNRCHI